MDELNANSRYAATLYSTAAAMQDIANDLREVRIGQIAFTVGGAALNLLIGGIIYGSYVQLSHLSYPVMYSLMASGASLLAISIAVYFLRSIIVKSLSQISTKKYIDLQKKYLKSNQMLKDILSKTQLLLFLYQKEKNNNLRNIYGISFILSHYWYTHLMRDVHHPFKDPYDCNRDLQLKQVLEVFDQVTSGKVLPYQVLKVIDYLYKLQDRFIIKMAIEGLLRLSMAAPKYLGSSFPLQYSYQKLCTIPYEDELSYNDSLIQFLLAALDEYIQMHDMSEILIQ